MDGAPATRCATKNDATTISEIYNDGIDDRVATFETAHRSPADIAAWFDGLHPTVVIESGGIVKGFATSSSYSARSCYSGIAEFSVYVSRDSRGLGLGKLLMNALISECRKAGFWKLVSRVFTGNAATLALLEHAGFRKVGIYEKHGRLDGIWIDVVIVEYLIRENIRQNKGV